MKLLVAPDAYLVRTPDGKYWAKSIYSYEFFERYLSSFEEVRIACRVKEGDYSEVEGYLRSDGDNITIKELPDMHGIAQHIKKFPLLMKAAKKASSGEDCAVFRVPSASAFMVMRYFRRSGKPYMTEVVVDPVTAYAESLPAKLIFTWLLKRACRKADGASYVTKKYLQERFPAYSMLHADDGHHFCVGVSDIRLKADYYTEGRSFANKRSFRIVHTANNMNNSVKGHAVLIRAMKKVIDDGFDISATFVGDGILRPEFEKLAEDLGIADRIEFTGMLSGSEAVRNELLKADMFVFPTSAEGLPRSIVEALAVGLPVISTPVAGIPELLEKEDMLPVGDVDAFAQRIEYFISNPELMELKSKRNVEHARLYSEEALRPLREGTYSKLRELAEEKGLNK